MNFRNCISSMRPGILFFTCAIYLIVLLTGTLSKIVTTVGFDRCSWDKSTKCPRYFSVTCISRGHMGLMF